MAKNYVLCARNKNGECEVHSVLSNKTKLAEAIEKVFRNNKKMKIVMDEKNHVLYNYSNLCRSFRDTERVFVIDGNGQRLFQVMEKIVNEVGG